MHLQFPASVSRFAHGRRSLTGLVAATLLCGSLGATANASDLPSAAPSEVGVDAAPLSELSSWLDAQGYDVRSLMVVKDGQVIMERYTQDLGRQHNYELYSVTKTVTALLAGLLIEEGKITLDARVADVIATLRPDLAERVADKEEVTLAHLLSMSSGLAYDFDPEGDPIYYGAEDRLALIADTPVAWEPGSAFDYTDVNPVFAAAMLEAAAGEPLAEYAERRLFEPLGMENASWQRADDKGLVSAGWGLRLRSMDLATLGQLLIDQGRFDGEQIVPEGWIAQMTTPRAARDFGYYLWLGHIVDTTPSFDMMGFKGQFVTALPERDAVVVMTAMLPIDGGLRHSKNVRIFRNVVNDYVLPALDGEGSAEADAALEDEVAARASSTPTPGVFVDPTDEPQS
ncbi:serine hydrolase domain-containing protein [Halomonas sp. S2151]|uniref:serine hydrolase domain-containing protein n=1 Tax=Halomonas sp. S2151 TaxID=579478 RepID=UPI000AF87A87|nr:serine hydrolase [Halomonas sp. S2151]